MDAVKSRHVIHLVPRSAATSENSKGVFHESLSILVEQGTDVVVLESLGRRSILAELSHLEFGHVAMQSDVVVQALPSASYLRLWDVRERRGLAILKFDPKKDRICTSLQHTREDMIVVVRVWIQRYYVTMSPANLSRFCLWMIFEYFECYF